MYLAGEELLLFKAKCFLVRKYKLTFSSRVFDRPAACSVVPLLNLPTRSIDNPSKNNEDNISQKLPTKNNLALVTVVQGSVL